jgi:hypothetical protein
MKPAALKKPSQTAPLGSSTEVDVKLAVDSKARGQETERQTSQREQTLQAYRSLGYTTPPKAKSVMRGQAVDALKAAQNAPVLAQLITQAQEAQKRLQALKSLLPATLLHQMSAGPIEDGTWVLMIKSAAAANKLRQMGPAMSAHLRSQGWPIQHIQIKVIQDHH